MDMLEIMWHLIWEALTLPFTKAIVISSRKSNTTEHTFYGGDRNSRIITMCVAYVEICRRYNANPVKTLENI